jgi:hypothetical protein
VQQLEGDMERKLSVALLCSQTRGKELTKIGETRYSLAYHAALRIADGYYIQVYLFSEEATRVRRAV